MTKKENNLIDNIETAAGTEKADFLKTLGFEILNTNLAKAEEYANESLLLSEDLKYVKGEAAAYYLLGDIYRRKNEFHDAIEVYNKCLRMNKTLKEHSNTAIIFGRLGICYWKLNIFDKALDIYLKALAIFIELDKKTDIARLYNNIGLVYWKIKQYDKALDYFFEALDMKQILGDQATIASTYNNIGNIYNNLKDADKALEYHTLSLKIDEQAGNKKGIANALNNVASDYRLAGKLHDALEYYERSLKMKQTLNDKRGIANTWKNIGKTHFDMKDFDKSIQAAEEAMKISLKIGESIVLQGCYELLSEAYTEKKDFQNVIKYYRLANQSDGKIFNEELRKKISEIENRFILAKKDRETALLAQQKDDLQKLNMSLQSSEEKYRTLIENLNEGMGQVDENEYFTFANQAACEIFGFSKDEIIGKNLKDFTSSEDFKNILRHTKERKKGVVSEYKLTLIRPDKTERKIKVKANPIFNKNSAFTGSIGLFTDITEEEIYKAELQKKNIHLSLMLETATQLTSSLDLQEVLRKIGTEAKTVLGAYGCAIYMLDEDKETLRPVVSLDPPYDEEILSETIEVSNSFTGRAVTSGKTLIFNDAGTSGDGYQIPGTSVVEDERVMVTPLIVENEILGAICLNKMGASFTQDDLSLTEMFAILASAALKNAQMHQQLIKEIQEHRVTTKALNSHEEHLKLMNKILRHDLINNLAVIKSALRMYSKSKDDKMLTEASNHLQKGLDLINRMRTLELFISDNINLKLMNAVERISNIAEKYNDIKINITGKNHILADDKIDSVLDNIFMNAKVHGKADEINVDIVDDNKMCKVLISNNGTNIPEEIKDKIFEENFVFGKTGHSGVGLYIVRKAMESFGGSVYAERNEPHGCTFVLSFRKL